MDLTDRLHQAIGTIYDSAFDGSRLSAGIASAASCVGAAGGMLAVIDVNRGEGGAIGFAGLDPELLALFEQRFILNQWTEDIAHHARVGEPMSSETYCDIRTLRRSEFYHAILRPQGLVGQSFVQLRRDGRFQAGFPLMYREPGRSAQGRTLDLHRCLAGHLGHAFELMAQVGTLRGRVEEGEEALEHLAVAVWVVDAQARVLRANRAALGLVRAGDGLTISKGRLVAARAEASWTVAGLLARAGTRGPRGGWGRVVVAREGALPLVVTALPATPSAALRGVEPGRVLVFAATPSALDDGLAPVLRAAFGLTEREALVAVASVKLGSLPAAARALGIAISTGRTHLNRVLEKTGCRRQVDLGRLLEALTAAGPGGGVSGRSDHGS